MTLGEMIAVLKRKPAGAFVYFDFVHFRPSGDVHSYRGYYEQFAIGYTNEGENVTAGGLLAKLEAACGAEFYGYKGGSYTMYSDTPVWVANHNESGGTAVVDIRDEDWRILIVTASID